MPQQNTIQDVFIIYLTHALWPTIMGLQHHEIFTESMYSIQAIGVSIMLQENILNHHDVVYIPSNSNVCTFGYSLYILIHDNNYARYIFIHT